jgi:hypothetical protein
MDARAACPRKTPRCIAGRPVARCSAAHVSTSSRWRSSALRARRPRSACRPHHTAGPAPQPHDGRPQASIRRPVGACLTARLRGMHAAAMASVAPDVTGPPSASGRAVLPNLTTSIASSALATIASAAVVQGVAARVFGLPATFTCAPSPTVPPATASVELCPSSWRGRPRGAL